MKTIFKSLLCLVSVLAIASCMKEEMGPSDGTLKEMTFRGEGVPTRTHFMPDNSVNWDSGDEISIFFEDGRHSKFSTVSLKDNGRTAIFSGLGTESASYYALYPYDDDNAISGTTMTATLPSLQKGVAGTFDQKTNLSAAKSSTQDLYFMNLGSLVGFSVNAYNGATSVRLESLDGQTLMSGSVSVDLSGDVPAMTVNADGGQNYVEMISPEGGFNAQSVYYFVIAPGKYKGFKLTFNNAALQASCEITTETEYDLTRNGHYMIPHVTIAESDWVIASDGDYVLDGKTGVKSFSDYNKDKISVNNLTVRGEGVANDELTMLAEVIEEVTGTVTFDGIGGNGWLTIANFIGKVPCKNIVVKNIIGTIEFKNWNCTKFDGSLHLENIGDLAAADWTAGQGGLDILEEVTGDLTVKNVKKMGAYTFINLKKVGGNLTIVQAIGTSDNLAEDMSAQGLSLESVGGDLVLENNPFITLAGFDQLTSIGGNVVLKNNNSIPLASNARAVGYCHIKDYMTAGVISPSATVSIIVNNEEVNVAELKGCAEQGGEVEVADVTLNGVEEIAAFVAEHADMIPVNNLTVTGEGVLNGELESLSSKISEVKGTLTFDGIGKGGEWLNGGSFLGKVPVAGDIVIKNVLGILEFKTSNWTVLNGGLYIENVQEIACGDWTINKGGLDDIVEIKGDLSVKGSGKIGAYSFIDLKKVGGNFSLVGTWAGDTPGDNLGGQGLRLESIGGDLVLEDLPINSLGGFDKLTSIGGNVIINCNNLAETNADGKIGYCLIKSYLEDGVIGASATVSITNNGNPVSVADLARCQEPQAPEVPSDPSAEDVVLEGVQALENFVAQHAEPVVLKSLTVTGEGIYTHHLESLASKISAVQGPVVFDGIGADGHWLTLGNFFGRVVCGGDITIKRIKGIVEFKNCNWTVLPGSLTIENIGDLACGDWTINIGGLDDITEVKGNLTVRGTGKIGAYSFIDLKKVGGSFTIVGTWPGDTPGDNLGGQGMSLEAIGGDLYLEDNPINTLAGFDNLQSIGGNVILNLSNLPATNADGKIGYCLIKDYVNSGVISNTATVTINGQQMDMAQMQGCAD